MAMVWILVHLASPPSLSTDLPHSDERIRRVISTKRDGGHFTVFSLADSEDSTAASSSSGRSELNSRLNVGRVLLRNVQSGLRSTFLPSGYPARTPPGYLRYSVWSWVQDLSTQLRSVLATQRVLEGVGVGREGATALSALLNFLVRDGCGMAASLAFTSAAASRFQSDVKRWRIFADVMVDIGITLEVAASACPPTLFLPMISLGNACKAMCGVAAGACGGAINLHWAKGSDISDIQAKFGAQHTVTGSLGLVFAAFFAKSVSTVPGGRLWILYAALTALHVMANLRCMRIIHFDVFNTTRLRLVLRALFESGTLSNKTAVTTAENGSVFENPPFPKTMPTPSEIAQIEPLLFLPQPASVPIYFGVSFDRFAKLSGKPRAELEDSLLYREHESYIISSAASSSLISMGNGRRCVVVALSSECTPIVQIQAYYHAFLLARLLSHLKPFERNGPREDSDRAESAARQQVQEYWKSFVDAAHHKGWDLTKTQLRTQGYEIEIQ
ncbi:predicted protein [Phaeodactylum tricornutum CCAP 1055/1]|uniref:Uncharacterized protein n=1 Tax=Phaeodactylum tricornutum (strain CCAP 1055/1) TaxID=556484 RepID=B7GD56_PHATC|nr:predicted protein [Phaeodactylum tricornutum CCAP 1055/1]EEC43518.1 predicted protein [Phaeodactylum tricornutum CCAP 1055/1]|eukprot:XP_002185071.1 predicted protein [Phaeodactylum tricornutum CCAP 1055/1]